LASEIDRISWGVENEGVLQYIEEIIRWTNKSLKALSFVSNEAGISKITKLQRDYEVLLNQSGKIGEYERLKEYTDIMEKEIADGQAEMRRAMEEPAIELEDFLINKETHYTKRDTPLTEKMSERDSERYNEDAERYGDFVREYTQKLRELEENERAYTDVLKDNRYKLSAEEKDEIMESLVFTRQAIKNLKGAKNDYLQANKDEVRGRAEYMEDRAKAGAEYSQVIRAKEAKERLINFINKGRKIDNEKIPHNDNMPPIRPDVRPTEQPRYDEQKRIMIDIQRRFKAELKEFFADDPATAIRTARIFLKDYGGISESKTRAEKRTDEEWFRSLLFKVDKLGKEKIANLEKQMGINFADYDAIEGMDKAGIFNRRGDQVGETTYGLGLSKKLAKHFREDEKEIKEMVRPLGAVAHTYATKELKRHKKAEKEAERASETRDFVGRSPSKKVSSSDDEAKRGGAGVGFRHKKIKVGRGITATETPSYLSFGKYVIHMGHLLDRNIANFKYPSLGSIPSIKPLTISEDYKEFILDTLDNQKPNERLFNKLSEDEQKHFERVVSGAGLVDTFKLKRNRTEQEKKDNERFELLRGEVMAGNNSEKVLKELRGLIVRFINEGRIHQREGTTMLMEISAL